MKVKKLMIIIGIVIVLSILYFMTPLFWGRVTPKGPFDIQVSVNGKTYTATMENNTSAYAFKKMLEKGPKSVKMRDYGGMEKVGMLWRRLPTNNQQMTAQPGDIILYMGSSIVVYYEPNSWNFTKLGHIEDIDITEFKGLLGNNSVTITYGLIEE